MPHRPRHGTQGLGSKPDTSAYKQAAQSMKSAGIKSLSGATTSDDKGKKAREIQEQFRNKSSNNNQSDPIVPKKKPPPDEEKKDFEIIAPGKDPDRDDRPKSKGLMKSETKSPNVFGLEYNMDLTLPSNTLLTPSVEQSTDLKTNLQNNDFKTNVTNTIMEFVPASLQDTVGASFVIAEAYFNKGIDFDVGKTGKVTLDWADDFSIQYNLEF
tara:strand:+ start:52 stop:687 length:636 start_codon:yes stop_codon:yes gene_type:complete